MAELRELPEQLSAITKVVGNLKCSLDQFVVGHLVGKSITSEESQGCGEALLRKSHRSHSSYSLKDSSGSDLESDVVYNLPTILRLRLPLPIIHHLYLVGLIKVYL